MTMQEIRQSDATKLRTEMARLRAQLREHRFATAVQQANNVRQRRVIKRTIARILTELRARASQQEVTETV